MTNTAPAFIGPTFDHPKAFAAWFKDLKRWDPASFQNINWYWPADIMHPLSSVLKMRKEKVNRITTQFADLQPLTIHFDGSVDKRKIEDNREYSMDLWFARPGDIVVAKIDLKNGAVGIIPPDWENVVVTGHFAVYQPNRNLLLPEYLHLIIQTSFFKAHLWRNKVGAEGRKEVKLGFFEAQEIPLPPLSLQQAIVERWQQAQEEIAAAQHRVEQLKAAIDERFLVDLGLKAFTQVVPPKMLAVGWKDFLRWSVSYNQAAQTRTDLTRGKYSVVKLGELLELVQYGTSEKATSEVKGTAIIRMNNIVDGFLNLTNLKYISLKESEEENLTLYEGDILFNRTNSKELVGKCAVFHNEGKFVFASYLIRVRVNLSQALPDFVSYAINSQIGRQQINALSRQIIGQANVNSEELRSLEIPLPPIEIQRQIMHRVEERRAQVTWERQSANNKAKEIKAEIEAIIVGTKKLTK